MNQLCKYPSHQVRKILIGWIRTYDQIMREKNKENIVDKDYILPKNRKIVAFYFMVVILLFIGISKWWIYLIFDFIQKGDLIQKEDLVVILMLGFPIGVLLLFLLLTSIQGFEKLTETIVISANSIKYSSIFKKMEYDWKDILKIEVVTHKQKSSITGSILTTKTDYNIYTSKGDFSLEENVWERNEHLRKAYEIIISFAPHAIMTQKEIESMVNDISTP